MSGSGGGSEKTGRRMGGEVVVEWSGAASEPASGLVRGRGGGGGRC
jgi:hypothetical protein